jgi:hypothetical protein
MTKVDCLNPDLSRAESKNKLAHVDIYVPQNDEQWYQSRCQLSASNQKKHLTRQNEILTAIRAFYESSGQKSNIKQTIEAAHCDYSTAKAALAAFDKEFQAKENLESLLIYVNHTNNKRLSAVITYRLQQLLDDAAYILFDTHHNQNIYLLTFDCPGNAEKPYSAIAVNSEYIANTLIDNICLLLPEDFQPDYIYAWEVQDRGSAHIHILLNLPNGHSVSQDKLTNIWLSVLDEVGDYYNINMYSNYDQPDYSPNSSHVIAHAANITPFNLQQNNNHQWSYLAKKKSKTPRTLMIAGNRAVAFQRWGGVSDSLKLQAQTLPLIEKIPVDPKEQVFDEIEIAKTLVESVVSVEWKEHFSYYDGQKHQLGYKTRLHPKDFKKVKQLLEQHAIALHNKQKGPFAPRAINFVVLELHPSGRCFLKHGFSRTNFKLQQLENKAEKHRRQKDR